MALIPVGRGLANRGIVEAAKAVRPAIIGSLLSSNEGTGNGSGGGNGSGNGNGSGDDSDGNDLDFNAVWKQLEAESPCIAKYKGRKIIQSKCKQYWYSKDTAGHGGAAIKRFEDTRSSLKFKDSLDKNLQPMTGKHESNKGLVIMKNDLDIVKRK